MPVSSLRTRDELDHFAVVVHSDRCCVCTSRRKFGAFDDGVSQLRRELALDHLEEFSEDNSLHALKSLLIQCSLDLTSPNIKGIAMPGGQINTDITL